MNLLYIWAFALLAKLCLLPFIPITPDEAYYFAWSRHLSLSYFDHPPVISWLMLLAQPFWKTPFGVRVPGVVLGHITLWIWVKILGRLGFSEKTNALWLVLVLVGPMTGLGGFIVTPDVPLLVFWSLALYVFVSQIEPHARPKLNSWILLGTWFGLGLISKYTMVLFPLSFLIFALADKRWTWLTSAGAYMAAATGSLFFAPVIAWNMQNHWASFQFQLNHGLNAARFNAAWAFEYLGGQFGLLNPVVATASGLEIQRNPAKNKILWVFGLTPLAFFLVTSFRSHVEANWPVMGYPALIALAAAWLSQPGRWPALWRRVAVILSACFFTFVLTSMVSPPSSSNPIFARVQEFQLWKSDLDDLKEYRPLFARSYQTAAFYSYFRPKSDEVFKIGGLDRRDFYDFQTESVPTGPFFAVLKADDQVPGAIIQKYDKKRIKELPSHFVLYQFILKP